MYDRSQIAQCGSALHLDVVEILGIGNLIDRARGG